METIMGQKCFLPKFSLLLIILTAIFCLATAPAAVLAQEEAEEGEETSHFNNAAQAQKAENLAEASAALPDTELANKQSAVTEAETALAEAASLAGLTVDEFVETEDAAPFVDALEAAQTAVDDHVSTTAYSTEQIADMRASGMGWGEIAHEIGVHPSTLGLGNKFGHNNQIREKTKAAHGYGHGKKADMMSSTARNLKTGGAKNFGQANAGKGQGNNNAGGLGQSKDKSNNGKGNTGKGNSGNNGKGKGKDK